jgi:hypothetical protein
LKSAGAPSKRRSNLQNYKDRVDTGCHITEYLDANKDDN